MSCVGGFPIADNRSFWDVEQSIQTAVQLSDGVWEEAVHHGAWETKARKVRPGMNITNDSEPTSCWTGVGKERRSASGRAPFLLPLPLPLSTKKKRKRNHAEEASFGAVLYAVQESFARFSPTKHLDELLTSVRSRNRTPGLARPARRLKHKHIEYAHHVCVLTEIPNMGRNVLCGN